MKLIVWIFVLAVSAHAQLSGTVIVFQLEPSGFFSAADSRAVLADGIPPEDSHCKIAALDRGVVFAVSGGYKYPPVLSDPVHPWSSIDEARIAVAAARNTGNIVTHMNAIADMWAANMKHNWEVVNKFHPEKVRDTANYGHGFLTYGIFAIGRNGILDVVA